MNKLIRRLNSVGKTEFVQAYGKWLQKGSITASDIAEGAKADGREVNQKSAETKASVFNAIIKSDMQAEALQECFNIKGNPHIENKAKQLFERHFPGQINAKLHKLWAECLEEWPVERLKTMTYAQYSQAGSHDTFCYWLEAKTTELGSIWGGSSFKFGVYSRADTENKESKDGLTYTETDAWLTKYGSNVEEAFATVKANILKIVECVQNDRLNEIDALPFGDAIKWKIAFLYQPQDDLKVVNVFTKKALQIFLNDMTTTSLADLHTRILSENPNEDIFELGQRIWSHYTESQAESEDDSMPRTPRNIILYGPPGTGKTYSLRNGEIEELSFLKDLPGEQEKFVTFHPSYSYEDFIEGISPVLDNESGQLRYWNKPGALKEIATLASADSVQLNLKIDLKKVDKWKMSLGNTSTREGDTIFETCMAEGIALFGFFDADLNDHISDPKSLESFLLDMGEDNQTIRVMVRTFTIDVKKKDIIIVTKGNTGGIRAIGQVEGDYTYRPDLPEKFGFSNDYVHARKVNWLWYDNVSTIPSEKLFNKAVSQRTIYNINPTIREDNLLAMLGSSDTGKVKNYVLKIDEINRGNVAKIFGELITLIEEDKRGDSVTLASGESFSVPDNLFIIGTMNTADRSLTHLDTALRRRFHFIEVPPRPDVLKNQKIGPVDLTILLERMNERMESLLGREHMLGHAYFMQDGEPISDEESFSRVIMNKVLPQLQEYFFDDYEQIQNILGNEVIEKERLATLPDSYANREVYRIKKLEQDELIQAIAVEYGFIKLHEIDDA